MRATEVPQTGRRNAWRAAVAAAGALIAGACAVADEGAAPSRIRAPDAGATDAAGGLVVPGAVDLGFGQYGIAALPRPGVEPRDLVVQSDGKILVVGSLFVDAASLFEGYVFRFLPDGSLDASFDGDGILRLTDHGLGAVSVALAANGKIVLGGSCDCQQPARVWRLNGDGSPDPSFGVGGEVDLGPLAAFIDHVVVEPDGAIRALGQALAEGLYVTRLRADGSVDPGYHGGVVAVTDFILHASVPQGDGSWLLAGAVDPWPERRAPGQGRTIDVARIGPDGQLDESFGRDGFVELAADHVGTAALVGDRLLLGLGQLDDAKAVHSRVEARRIDGQLDESFGQAGASELGRTSEVYRILAHDDGSLEVVTGDPAQLSIHRRRADGGAIGVPWVTTLPETVWLDHLAVALDPRSGDLFAAAIQHQRVVDATGLPRYVVTGTGLVRIPR